jgi:hypothetical protein
LLQRNILKCMAKVKKGVARGVSKGGKKGAKAPVVRARKTSGRLPATGSVVSVSDLATKTLPELKSLCETEGLNGGELEWQLRNTLMLHFGYGPLPLPTYTLSDLRAMTVVELRSACVIVGLPDGGVKKDVLDRLVAHFGHSPAGVDGGSGAGVVVGAGVPGAGVMTLQDLVANGIMHKELESHVSGCLDREGVVGVIFTVVIYRSGGTCFNPKVNLGYPFGRHTFANTAITYISGEFTDGGIGDYTVAFKLSNAVNGAAQRRWVVAMFESLYQSLCKQSNGMLPVLTATRFGDAFDEVLDLCLGSMPSVAAVSSLGVFHHAQLASPAVTPVKTVKSLSDFEGEYRDQLRQSETGAEGRSIGRNSVPSASCMLRAFEKLRATPAFHTDHPSCQVSAMKPYANVSGQKIYDLARESGLVISVSDSSITKAETSDDATARVQKEFNSETLYNSFQKGVMSANGTWVLCFGAQDVVGGVTEARFSRRSVERYLSALTDLSRVPGLTGEEFRRVLLQTETMRIAAVNEGRMPGSMSGARATVGRGYDIATDRIEECVRDFFVRPVGRVVAPNVPPTHNTQTVGSGGVSGVFTGSKPGNANGAPPVVRAKRPQDARLPGGMGSKHLGGDLCKKDEHNPTKGGNVKAMCAKSHVHWDAALEPTQSQIDDAIAKGIHPKDRRFGLKKKK